jgi:type I restriction enzyme S subunit
MNWRRETVGTACRIFAGYGFPERLQGRTTGDVAFYKVGDISEAWKRGETYLTAAKHYLTDAEVRELRAKPLPAGTTVFAKIGAAIALNRRAILSAPALVDNNVMGLLPANGDLDHKFLFHFVCTLRLNELSRATTVPSVRKTDVERIELPLPPLDEQQRIVAEIEKHFTRLDAGVASLKRVQAALKRHRASLLKTACEGRLVPTEAELARKENRSYETGEQLLQRILKERREKWNSKGKYKEPVSANIVDLPKLPQGWTWATVEQLAALKPNSITDGPFGSNLKTEHYTNTGPRVVRLQNIGTGTFIDEEAHISKAHFDKLQKHRVFAGDLVIAALGENPPRSCVIPDSLGPAIVKADCIRFKPHAAVVTKYANFALNSDPVRKRSKNIIHGVGRPRLNLSEIKSIVLPLPPTPEQTRIVAEAEAKLSVVEELGMMVAAQLQRATRVRQSILEQAFKGKLTARSNIVA